MELPPREGERKPSKGILSAKNAYGSVEDCIDYVQQLKDAGADEILFMTNMGTVPQWASERSSMLNSIDERLSVRLPSGARKKRGWL